MVADDGCVSVSLCLSQNVITTLVRNPSLRDSFVVAGAVACLSGCVVRCCQSFAKIIHDRPKAMEKRDCGTLMDVKLVFQNITYYILHVTFRSIHCFEG